MGNYGAPDSISALYESLLSRSRSRSNQSGLSAVWQFCNEARIAAQRTSLTSVANCFSSLYRNDREDRGKVVFLTTFIIAMAGCGLLTSLLRRRLSSEQSPVLRPTVRKTSTKSSTRTLTSSDDDYEDDDESNGSLRQGTASQRKATEWSAQPQQQGSDGKQALPYLRHSVSLTLGQPSRQILAC